MKNASDINGWLITTGRMLGDDQMIIDGYANALSAVGVPVNRITIAQRFANPLLAALAITWVPTGVTTRPIPRTMLATSAYKGSPFEYVQEHRTTLRRKLADLDPEKDHQAYLDQANAGATEYIALVLEFGDGSVHSCSFTTSEPGGFRDEQVRLIEETRHALASVLEPVTMRRSTGSLLQAYLGNGPAAEVIGGTIERGAHTVREAVVMITDLRQFTWMSENWTEVNLLSALDQYFEAVVGAVRAHDGDVLKFMGDGVLSIFVIDKERSRAEQSTSSINAARAATAALEDVNSLRRENNLPELAMGIGIDVGMVTYGNIGSPERLDFTVLGRAVNMASRVQDLCKVLGETTLVTTDVATESASDYRSRGHHEIRGVADTIEIYAVD